ncbi:CDP-diacylglycerol--glycerol-3-phosphate 3-phosphatidyltransferase [Mycoplasmopsis ciconiae]|uniref:CDP-diacylglycerol--glycerol-3-phosphate 3-phosphatidyltransferase n=1 Tax=Mycoplasmopsis ciconiae TaxID=561067 RepID=A0ABU7MLM3_9BACT|nr:CDP-diacylglycerol--glycerol-3-phosphate 3-phosphatidyltransferase [Mycoplasmopsis ciconiae]
MSSLKKLGNWFVKLNLPNKLTLLRLILVIPFIIFGTAAFLTFKYALHTPDLETIQKQVTESVNNFLTGNFQDQTLNFYKESVKLMNISRIMIGMALLIFVVAMVTDYFDGKIAREKAMVTEFGKLWDPIADKFITTSALILMAMLQVIPFWLVLIFVLRDLVVAGARVVMTKNNISVAADKYGKYKTALMSAAIVIIMLVYIIYPLNAQIISLVPSTQASPFTTEISPFISQEIKINSNYYWFTYIVNLPLIVAAAFNVFSGIRYVQKIIPYIK